MNRQYMCSQGAFMASRNERMTLYSWLYQFFFILQLTWFVLQWIQDIDCKYWKCFHLTNSYLTFKGLTWASACSSSLTVKPFAVWPRSVLTMWCSTTWLGGSLNGFSVLCKTKKKEKRSKKQTKEKEQLKFNYEKYRQKLALWTSLIIPCL